MQDWKYAVAKRTINTGWLGWLSSIVPRYTATAVTLQSTEQSAPSTYYILYWCTVIVDGNGIVTDYREKNYNVP